MNYFKYTILFLLIILNTGCSKDDNVDDFPEFELSTPDEFSDEDYKVYSSFLEQYNTPNVVVSQESSEENFASAFTETTEDDFWVKKNLESRYPDFEASLFTKLIEVNLKTKFFDDKFSVNNKMITLITEPELTYISELSKTNTYENLEGFWDYFYKIHPQSQGYVSLSLISYSENKDQAVFEIWNACGGLCGDGGFVYCRKENGVWTFIDAFLLVAA
ncbi:MAG: hypothetical protein NWQ06_10740 [Leeuwenhoekiella sp.]|nr:hypothetical protein [Leeuwenhoekiella sp.]